MGLPELIFCFFSNQMHSYSIAVCTFVSVVWATALLPAPVPIHFSWKSGSFPPAEIFIFPLCLHFKLSNMCVFVSFEYQFGAEDFVSAFLSFFLPFHLSCILSFTLSPPFVFLHLCHTLLLPHALSFPLSPLSTSSCKRANVYFKRCAMHQPPPHSHSAEEKTGTTHAC